MQPWLDRLAALVALTGPPVIGLGAIFVSGRGADAPPLLLGLLALVPTLVGAGWLLFRRRKLAILAGLELLGLLAFMTSFTPFPAGTAPAREDYAFRTIDKAVVPKM